MDPIDMLIEADKENVDDANSSTAYSPHSRHSQLKRWAALVYRQYDGMTYEAVAQKINTTRKLASEYNKKYDKYGAPNSIERSGRPSKLTPEKRKQLEEAARNTTSSL